MAKKQNITKDKIVLAAWKLFYEQGYEDTTVEEIIDESGTSRGSFYHYFEGKDALLGSLSYLFDKKYEELDPSLAEKGTSMEQLLYLNRELFAMIENSISVELLSRLLSSQLITHGERHLLDRSRLYYRLLNRIVSAGQQNGELTNAFSTGEIVKAYAMCERAMMYDWCICAGEYSLKEYAKRTLPVLLGQFLS